MMRLDPNMLPDIVARIFWCVIALLATRLLVCLLIMLMRDIARLP